jgi:predicted ATPase
VGILIFLEQCGIGKKVCTIVQKHKKQMKTFVTGVVLISFLAISVFGFIGLSEMHKQMGSDCSESVTQGVACPVKDGVLAFALFHLKTLQGLSQSSFLNVSPIFLFVSLLAALAVALFVSPSALAFSPNRSYFRKNYEDKVRDVGPKTISWLARLENSPSFVSPA